MKTKEITAYFCDHCNKLYQRKHFLPKHEKQCKKNPDNQRPCFTCNHLQIKEHIVMQDTAPSAPDEYKMDLLYCSKNEFFVYPPIIEHKKNWIETWEPENNPMPRKCVHYFSDLIADMINKETKEISKKELEDFKLVATDNIELGEAIFQGFMERKSNPNALPF